jgi:DNA polymerase-3 subunit beta
MSRTAVKERPQAEAPAVELHATLNRAEFLRALGFASAIVERRNTIPVLSNVLLEATSDQLKITATDLNLQISLTVPAMIEGEGAITVSAQMIHGIVRELPDGAQVELKLADNRLQVLSGRSRYKLQTIPRTDFPVMRREAAESFALPASDLTRAFARVAFAQSTETIVRGYLCGINVETADGELFFVATDGNRLAWSTLPAPEGVALENAILPTKLVSTLAKLLDGHDGDVSLSFEERKVTAEIGDTVLSGKLVEGTFPPWRRVVPPTDGKRLLIAGASFEDAIRRVALIANERLRAVKVELTTDKLTATCTSPEFGVAVEEAPCVWDEPPLEIGFNARFLLDVIAAAGEEVQVDLFDATSPTLFTNPNDESAKWIVTPMRV